MHKPIRYRFPRRRTIVRGIDSQWQLDLVELGSISDSNDGYRYLLVCVDVFSKFCWIRPLHKKTGEEVVQALKSIFNEGRVPEKIQTDKGKEFLNKHVQSFLKINKVQFFTTFNYDTKCSIVERLNRTLKTKMWRYFTFMNTRRYVDILQELAASYNKSRHRSIGMAPVEVNVDNSNIVWNKLYGDVGIARQKFKVGDNVRITKERQPFRKGYLPNWSEEIFVVNDVNKHGVPYVYILNDLMGEILHGTFYEEELQKVTPPEIFKVEKVLKERRTRNGKEYFVKWMGYPTKFNSWISDMHDI